MLGVEHLNKNGTILNKQKHFTPRLDLGDLRRKTWLVKSIVSKSAILMPFPIHWIAMSENWGFCGLVSLVQNYNMAVIG